MEIKSRGEEGVPSYDKQHISLLKMRQKVEKLEENKSREEGVSLIMTDGSSHQPTTCKVSILPDLINQHISHSARANICLEKLGC